jgi:hypothetical protein
VERVAIFLKKIEIAFRPLSRWNVKKIHAAFWMAGAIG